MSVSALVAADIGNAHGAMNRKPWPQRSSAVAVWLFLLAGMVVAMVIVGGATRLTHSGLSITEWKPIRGAIPPLNPQDWSREFAHYRQIPQYRLLNRGMSLESFKAIFWWEWAHRLLGRLVGLAFALPFAWFVWRGEMPGRLLWRCVLLFALGGLQGLIGWWMVSSGLERLTSVAPERLAIHLGAALILFLALIWTGLEALAGQERAKPSRVWVGWSGLTLAMGFTQCLLGALVAGNHAGLVYNDWPLMNGRFLPAVAKGQGPLHALVHDIALVQFDHRMFAYLILAVVTTGCVRGLLAALPEGLKLWLALLLSVVWLQALLGVATLMAVAPLWLSMLHQIGATLVLAFGSICLWRMLRFEPRQFGGGIGSRAL